MRMINRQPSHHQYLQIWDYLTIFSVSLMVSMIVEFFILILSSIIHSPTLDTLADIVFGICAARVPSPASNPSLQRHPHSHYLPHNLCIWFGGGVRVRVVKRIWGSILQIWRCTWNWKGECLDWDCLQPSDLDGCWHQVRFRHRPFPTYPHPWHCRMLRNMDQCPKLPPELGKEEVSRSGEEFDPRISALSFLWPTDLQRS